jgi:S-adenosylmethionine:tRNA ribosyltransferase-isomerase
VTTTTLPVTAFTLPPGSEATAPPEARGLARDGVSLLVARESGIRHRSFRDLPDLLEPGDLVVVNTSGTRPAAVDTVDPNSGPVPVHVATTLDDGSWVVEIRRPDGRGPDTSVGPGRRLPLPAGLTLELTGPHLGESESVRLWVARPSRPVDLDRFLAEYGRPITYGYLAGRYPLADYQTVYAAAAGSAEMPSAGRPFTEQLLVRLMARGITIAPVVLHAGVSSPDAHEPPMAERFDVPAATARLVASARSAGNRVVAVGTTVVRALETVAGVDGAIRPGHGWTDLVLGPDRPVRVVDGLITGLHEPRASHLLVLEAVAGPPLVGAAYAAAVECGYLWHEFGDSTLLLP